MARIGIEFTAAHAQSAGIGRVVSELVQAVIAQNTRHQLTLFSASHQQENPFPHDAQVHWKHSRVSHQWLSRLWRMRIPLRIEQWLGEIDLFHATDFVLPPTHKRTKTVVTIHDLAFIRVPEAATPRLRRYLNDAVMRSVHRADFIVTVSHTTLQDVADIYRIPKEKIGVVYHALPSYTPKRSQPAQHTFPQLTRPYLFSVGTVQPRKNYSRVVKALARLRSQGLDIDFVIAGGRGWLEDDLYKTIEDTKMHSYVHILGFVPDEQLASLYQSALCLAYPSLYEGFGFPILEGMSHGIPVVTAGTSSMPEVAGEAAVLVDPYDLEAITDALQRTITDTALRDALITRGYEQVKKFSWQQSAEKLLQIYDDVLAQ